MEGLGLLMGLLWLVLAGVTAMVAADRGRSMVGWFFLGLLFPVALLFALILPDAVLEKKMHHYYDSANKSKEPDVKPKIT